MPIKKSVGNVEIVKLIHKFKAVDQPDHVIKKLNFGFSIVFFKLKRKIYIL